MSENPFPTTPQAKTFWGLLLLLTAIWGVACVIFHIVYGVPDWKWACLPFLWVWVPFTVFSIIGNVSKQAALIALFEYQQFLNNVAEQQRIINTKDKSLN